VEINADFTRRVVVHASRLPWTPSPIAGVERRMLDRIGDEVARATSIVRYAPESRFSAHTHGGGEEFLVLDGIFQDEHGDYPAGTYVRNPPTSRHTPGSEAGCTLFVKLWQFDPEDRTEVRLATGDTPYRPAPGRAGVAMLPLFADGNEEVRLERWDAGARVKMPVPGGGELLVLAGRCRLGGEECEPYSWLRLPCGATLDATAGAAGVTLWVKTGHLRRIAAPPAA